jgi:hypothetical protein
MSSVNPAANADAPQTISLRDVGLRYVQFLQRLFDVTAFSLASARVANEQGYDEFVRSVGVLPAGQFHLGFDLAKEETGRWWLTHGVNEALNIVAMFLEDCRKLAALCEIKGAQNKGISDVSRFEQKLQTNEIGVPIPQKLSGLQSGHGVTSPFAEQVLDLDNLRRCMFEQRGVAGEAGLTVRLKQVQIVPASVGPNPGESSDARPDQAGGNVQLTGRLVDAARTFAPGERIMLSKAEHMAIFITLSVFLSSMLDAIHALARRTGADAA